MSLALLAARAAKNHRSSGGDPYWGNVISMLNFNGANGSTSFVDSKGGFTWANDGSPVLSTTVGNPFGSGTALSLNGSSAIYTPTALSLGSGDFCVEGWVYLPNSTAYEVFYDGRNGNGGSGIGFYVSSTSGLFPVIYQGSSLLVTSSTSIPASTWTHIELDRSANTLYLFIGGVLAGTASSTSVTGDPAFTLLGRDGPSAVQYLNGYVGGSRLTVGVARNTANFTPPSAPFPNHA